MRIEVTQEDIKSKERDPIKLALKRAAPWFDVVNVRLNFVEYRHKFGGTLWLTLPFAAQMFQRNFLINGAKAVAPFAFDLEVPEHG